MTTRQLEEFGFYKDGLYSVYHPLTEISIGIGNLKKLKPQELIEKFGNEMFEWGKKAGENHKIEEIKKALNLS
jgi:hypothetical protein